MHRLGRLAEEKFCDIKNVEEHRDELVELGTSVLQDEAVKKEGHFFKALSEPKRLAIIKLLEMREMCVCELTIALNLSQPAVSHHINILENIGILKRENRGRWSFYALTNKVGKSATKTIKDFVSSII